MSTQDDLNLIRRGIGVEYPGEFLREADAALARVVARLGKLEAVAEAARRYHVTEEEPRFEPLRAALAGLGDEQ